MSRLRWLGLLALVVLPALLLLARPGTALEPEPEAEAGPELPELEAEPVFATVPADLRSPALSLAAPLRRALRLGRWDTASRELLALGTDAFAGGSRGDWAFLAAWSLVRADRAEEAVPLMGLVEGAKTPPPAYRAQLRGEVLLETGEPLKALQELSQIPDDHPLYGRAAVLRAETLKKIGRTREAFELYESLAARPDPARGSPEALLALGLRHGVGSEGAYPYLRRLWVEYPGNPLSSEAAQALSSGYGTPPTWQQVTRRAERRMARNDFRGALVDTGRVRSQVEGEGIDVCRFAYVRGRSFYRTGQLANAITAFGDHGARCVGEASHYGAPMLYLQGMAQFRRRAYPQAAETFVALAEHHPEDSLADDGLFHAGVALQLNDDLDGAYDHWARALRSFPEGDMVPEATWRAAFSHYLEGRPKEARELARALGTLSPSLDPVHVAAGRYWHARWSLYPDVDAPTVPDPEGREAAIAGWRALCEESPHSYYAVLAYGRLLEEAPEVAAELAERPEGHDAGDLEVPWSVSEAFLERPEVQEAVALARLGLMQEAFAWWREVDTEALSGEEKAFWIELRTGAGDWLFAHDTMRSWIRHRAPSSLGEGKPRVLRVAYPDRYWDEVRAAAEGHRYDARLFHALVREESNFNRRITSHAGARGLAQLMPGTAQEVAGWMGRRVTDRDLEDPDTNLALGARYFDAMHRQFHGSPYLSLAAYNAGGGRVRQWQSEWGDVPTDEYVERIPFKETRDYVRRVMGTWQIMRWQFDVDNPAFADLSAFNHTIAPE